MSTSPHSSAESDTKPVFAWKPLLIKVGFVLAGGGACAAVLLGLALALALPSLPDLHAMTDYRPSVPLRIYTSDKVLIGEYGEEHRNVLRFEEIPALMRNAVLAAEDDHFYQHGGVSWMGMLRAVLKNITTGSKAEGGSTITMQLARNFYLSSEKTYSRKFYELLLTFKIESALTKDQILMLYMNQIYLGHRAYGFAAAARTYFNKPLSEVTPAEAAILAGIPKSPSRLNPMTNLPRSQIRQRYVLNRMKILGYLTAEQTAEALAQPLSVRSAEGKSARGFAIHGEYPAELARQLVYGVFQDETYTKGIDVYTTINAKAQEAAYQSVRQNLLEYTRRSPYPGPEDQIDLPENIEQTPQALDDLLDSVQEKTPDNEGLLTAVVLSASPTTVTLARSARELITITDKKTLAVVARALSPTAKGRQRLQRGSVVYLHKTGDDWEIINLPTLQAALVSLAPQDGAIQAMIGGFDPTRGTFNRATQAWRQPGSNIKPFVYASALERGFTPATQISDQPFTLTAEQTGSKPWAPKNDGNRYEPMLTLRQALLQSKNMVSIRLVQAITPQYTQAYLSRFGFEPARWPAVLPMALGAGSATPLQVANAYTVLANGGYRLNPYLIDRVTDRSGKVLMQAQPVVAGTASARAIDPRTAWVIDDILRDITVNGTAARAHQVLKRNDIGGKTGTTNDSIDVWFSGFAPNVVATVWMGFDQPRSLGSNEFGSGLALSTWLNYVQPMVKGVPETKPNPMPNNLLQVNGDYYFSEYPPGQAVATLDLPTDDANTAPLNVPEAHPPTSAMPPPAAIPANPQTAPGVAQPFPIAVPESPRTAPSPTFPPIPVPGIEPRARQ